MSVIAATRKTIFTLLKLPLRSFGIALHSRACTVGFLLDNIYNVLVEDARTRVSEGAQDSKAFHNFG
jgi:hypothetical protein